MAPRRAPLALDTYAWLLIVVAFLALTCGPILAHSISGAFDHIAATLTHATEVSR